MHKNGHRISRVEEGSIAADLGLRPGDRLAAIDGLAPIDVFDYQLRQMAGQLIMTVRTSGGELIEFDIEKDEDEDLGLSFENPMMDDCRICRNHCVFCFIDQLPKGLRPSLYIKDDDMRLSFLTGNYVTLTNLDEDGLDRLIASRLSPVNVSVHATDPGIRRRMLRNKDAGSLMPKLRKIAASGLQINAQVVLCPGINDGEQLDRTIGDLVSLGSALQSVAVVPVGITRYRDDNRLTPIKPLSQEDAVSVLRQVYAWQGRMLAERGTRLVYAADEFYLLADRALPPAGEYEDFPQLENGVGMASLLADELKAGLRVPVEKTAAAEPAMTAIADAVLPLSPADTVLLVTGTAAAPLFRSFQDGLSAWSGIQIETTPVINRFFGETVTVAGLLTGQDLAGQLPETICRLLESGLLRESGRIRVLLPSCIFKSGEDLMLDDMTLRQLSSSLGVAVHVCPPDAAGLLGTLAWLKAAGAQSTDDGRNQA